MFSNQFFGESQKNSEFVCEATTLGLTPDSEGAALAILESTMDFVNLQEASYKIDLAEMVAIKKGDTAALATLTEAAVPKFIQTIIDGLKKFGGMVMEILNKFKTWLDTTLKGNADFVVKYGPKVIGLKLNGFEFEGYDYNPTATTAEVIVEDARKGALVVYTDVASMSLNDIESLIEKSKAKSVDELVFTGAGDGTTKDLASLKAFFKEMLFGSKEKVKVKIDLNKCLETIKGGKEAIKAIDTSKKAINKAVNDSINAMKKVESEYKKNASGKDADAAKLASAQMAAVGIARSYESKVQTAAMCFIGVQLEAAKAEIHQARTIIGRAVTYKEGKKDAAKPVAEGLVGWIFGE